MPELRSSGRDSSFTSISGSLMWESSWIIVSALTWSPRVRPRWLRFEKQAGLLQGKCWVRTRSGVSPGLSLRLRAAISVFHNCRESEGCRIDDWRRFRPRGSRKGAANSALQTAQWSGEACASAHSHDATVCIAWGISVHEWAGSPWHSSYTLSSTFKQT